MSYKTFKQFINEFTKDDEKLIAARERAKNAAAKTNDIAKRNKERAADIAAASKERLAAARARQIAAKQRHDDQVAASVARSKR